MKIGNLEFKHGLFLAPMAGITDIPFRKLCKKYGAEGLFTEMISSRALCFKDEKTHVLAKIEPDEHPCFLQIFGNDPETMAESAELALKFQPDVIDINMGCPAPKIAGNGDGSALMKNPILAHNIVKAVKDKMAKFGIPVSVKIRSGFDREHINAIEIAKACEAAGVDLITVHGRTKDQMYAPPVNLDIIKEVKASVSVPVIGNGDVTDFSSAKHMYEYTGCDGIMIGRGALGNPYIFDEIICGLEGKPYLRPDNATLKRDITDHMTMLVETKGEYIGSREARKHIAWYLKGMKGAAAYRDSVNRATTLKEVIRIVNEALS